MIGYSGFDPDAIVHAVAGRQVSEEVRASPSPPEGLPRGTPSAGLSQTPRARLSTHSRRVPRELRARRRSHGPFAVATVRSTVDGGTGHPTPQLPLLIGSALSTGAAPPLDWHLRIVSESARGRGGKRERTPADR